jgi:hypothetical protein
LRLPLHEDPPPPQMNNNWFSLLSPFEAIFGARSFSTIVFWDVCVCEEAQHRERLFGALRERAETTLH